MLPDLIQLAYFSSESPGWTAADRESIVTKSRRNNARFGITGLLLYNQGNFLQILEGPRDPVLRRFAVIQEDPRHTGATEIFQQPAQARSFPDSPMGFCDLRSPGTAIDGYEEFLREHFDLGALQPTGVIALFDLFRRARSRTAAPSQGSAAGAR